MIALGIIALTAVMLLDRRVELVRDASRSRDLRTVWILASQKMAELELDRTLWTGQGSQSSGDFGEMDASYAPYTWEYMINRQPVETIDPLTAQPTDRPKEILRLTLAIRGPALDEPLIIEGQFPIQEVKAAAPEPAPEEPPGPGQPAAPGPGRAEKKP